MDAELQKKNNGDDGMSFSNNTTTAAVQESENALESKPISALPQDESAAQDIAQNLSSNESIQIQSDELHTQKIHLMYEKDKIIRSIDSQILEFDNAVDVLRQDRAVLEADLKAADIKLLLLYQEWVLLKEFEKFDIALSEKLDSKKGEKLEIDGKINECRDRLASKKEEIELVIQKEKQIQSEFQHLLGENNKNEEYITKVYKRKIKRAKVNFFNNPRKKIENLAMKMMTILQKVMMICF